MGVVHIPWYATGFRGDAFEEALNEIAPVALRYGATEYWVFRRGDDRYMFQTYFLFEDHHDFEQYWYGPEFQDWRARYSSWYQVPVVYTVAHEIASGAIEHETVELDV